MPLLRQLMPHLFIPVALLITKQIIHTKISLQYQPNKYLNIYCQMVLCVMCLSTTTTSPTSISFPSVMLLLVLACHVRVTHVSFLIQCLCQTLGQNSSIHSMMLHYQIDKNCSYTHKQTKQNKLCCFSPRANYTERPLLVGEVSANFYG
jgi:hypothetical protein